MRWTEVVWEVGRAVYSIGLLALGVVLLRSLPHAVRVLRELTSALVATAEGLRAFVVQRDALEAIREGVERLEREQRAQGEALRRVEERVNGR